MQPGHERVNTYKIVPQSKGGIHRIDNLQHLCNACNSKKGAGSQGELIVKLQEEGILG